MIDTHLHILPGIDDGPQTIEEALVLAYVLVQEGVHTAIATPHYNDEFSRRSAIEIRERVNDLQFILDRQGIPLRLFAGHEALIKPDLVEDIQSGRCATLNGSCYVLLELWNNSWGSEIERVIFEMRACGLIPIIAHPERYDVIQHDPSRLADLLRLGAQAQVVASSLIGRQGKTAQHCAEVLLKKNLIHYIASDAHSLHRRPPRLVDGIKRAVQLVGQNRVHQLTDVHPAAVVNNHYIQIQTTYK